MTDNVLPFVRRAAKRTIVRVAVDERHALVMEGIAALTRIGFRTQADAVALVVELTNNSRIAGADIEQVSDAVVRLFDIPTLATAVFVLESQYPDQSNAIDELVKAATGNNNAGTAPKPMI